MSKSSVIVLPLELVDSEAFQSLNGTAIRVLLHFFRKRQLSEIKSGNGKRSGYVIRNNGEIVYPYSEALKQGMYRQRFSAALKQLLDRGFISVERGGDCSVNPLPTGFIVRTQRNPGGAGSKNKKRYDFADLR